jgi:type II secretory pathway pseudopilin PulG
MAEAQAIEEENVEVTLDEEQKDAAPEDAVNVSSEEEVSKDAPSEDELDSYSKGVQKRIKKLTEKYRYAERDKEEAARIADVLKKENEQLKTRLNNLDQGYLSEYGTRLESQLNQAKAAYRDAHDRGDVDKMFEAQQALSQISIEQERYRLAKQRQEQNAQAPVQSTPTEIQSEAPAQAAPATPDPKAEKWAEKNTWFGEDEIMTQAAFVIHNNLVNDEGFDPSGDEYYDELDARLRKRFPNEMGGTVNGGSSRVASASTSASRSGKQGRRTVKLSPSQVAMAKKLGVPLEEYAKYVKD